MSDWISFYISFIGQCVNWLSRMEIMGFPVLIILLSIFLGSVFLRGLLFKA